MQLDHAHRVIIKWLIDRKHIRLAERRQELSNKVASHLLLDYS